MKWIQWVPQNSIIIPPLVPQSLAANTLAATAGTPMYFRYKVTYDHCLSGLSYLVATFTTNSVYKFAWYNYSASGTITKKADGLGSSTVTATGEYTVNFTTPICFNAGTDAFLGFMLVSGSSAILGRSSGPNLTALNFSGTALLSDMPATESTRGAYTTYPYFEFISNPQ